MRLETGYSISLFKCRHPSEDQNLDLLGFFGKALPAGNGWRVKMSTVCCLLGKWEMQFIDAHWLWYLDRTFQLSQIISLGCYLDVQGRTGHPLHCLDYRLHLASRPLMCPTTCAMLPLLPHSTHTHSHHTKPSHILPRWC